MLRYYDYQDPQSPLNNQTILHEDSNHKILNMLTQFNARFSMKDYSKEHIRLISQGGATYFGNSAK